MGPQNPHLFIQPLKTTTQNTNSLAKLTPIHLRSNRPPLTMEAKSEKADQKSSVYYVAT